MVEVIRLGREHGYQRLENTIERALALGCSDVEAIRYLLLESRLERARPEPLHLPQLMEYDSDRCFGIVAADEFFSHPLNEFRHRDSFLSVSEHSPSAPSSNTDHAAGVRRASGFVVC